MHVTVDRARDIARDALDNGGQLVRPTTVAWNVAGKCSDPHFVEIAGRPERQALPNHTWSKKLGFVMLDRHAAVDRHTYPGTKGQHPLWVDMTVGCRKCPACLRARMIHWRERAVLEINAASRTWFGTLTLSPHEHWLSQCRARVEFAGLSAAEQFAERHRANGVLLTNYVKRIRKHAGAGLRFLCVAEAHKSGLPHYHMLVHEPHRGSIVRHAQLSVQWTHGFTTWKLVRDAKAANYVAKYLAKSSLARVRASVGYGNSNTALAIAPEGGVPRSGGSEATLPPSPPSTPRNETSD